MTEKRCPRSALLKQHRPLVLRIARKLKSRLSDAVQMDDLVQAGMLGLEQALQGFDERQGASFDTYAFRRIQGSMMDELRTHDTVSRGVRSRMRQVQLVVQRLEHQHGRAPRAIEISQALGWTLQELHDTMVEAGAPAKRLGDEDLETVENEVALALQEAENFDDVLSLVDGSDDPAKRLQRRQEHDAVNSAFETMDVRMRDVLRMIYQEDMTQQDVAVVLGVTPSRVCQMHAAALALLKIRTLGIGVGSEADSRMDSRMDSDMGLGMISGAGNKPLDGGAQEPSAQASADAFVESSAVPSAPSVPSGPSDPSPFTWVPPWAVAPA